MWIQHVITTGRINELTKNPGKVNTADILTRGVDDQMKHCKAMHLYVSTERALGVPVLSLLSERARGFGHGCGRACLRRPCTA